MEDQSSRPDEQQTLFVLSDRIAHFDDQLKYYLAMREVIDAWVADYNTARPHSSLAYKTPTAYAAHLTAIGPRAALLDSSALRPIAQPTPNGVLTAEALIAAG